MFLTLLVTRLHDQFLCFSIIALTPQINDFIATDCIARRMLEVISPELDLLLVAQHFVVVSCILIVLAHFDTVHIAQNKAKISEARVLPFGPGDVLWNQNLLSRDWKAKP